MRKTLLILICFLFLIGVAYSAVVEVGIAETLEGNISSLNFDVSSNVAKFSIEFYNTGSVPYKARIKTEIFNNSDMVFSGWGQEMDFMSGEKKISDIYWYANNIGDYFAKLKVYFGNDVKEYRKFGFSVSNFVEAEDVFKIKDLRTYDNYIVFDVQSREDVENVIVIPNNYTPGWIFEQEEIGNMSGNSSKFVLVNYYPTIWKPSNVSLSIVSSDGRYYTEERVEIRKNEGLIGLVYYILDSLRITFFK
jgi:hypothetical protein